MIHRNLHVIMAALMISLFLTACNSSGDSYSTLLPHEEPVEDVELYLELANAAIEQKNYREGKNMLEKILRYEPDNPRARLILAHMYFNQGKLELATVAYRDLIEKTELRAKAYQGYGLSLLKSGKLDTAAAALKNSVKYDHSLWRAWNALGYYYDMQENWLQAQASYDMALKFNIRSSMLYNNRGFSFILQHKADLAVHDLTKAVLYDPDNRRAATNLQIALAMEGDYRRAVSLSENNKQSVAMNNAGYVAILNGDYDSAEKLLKMAMKNSYSFNEKAWKNINFLNSLKQIKADDREL